MIARAALGRPWIFKQAAAALRGEPAVPEPTLIEQRDILLRHQTSVVKRFGEERGNGSRVADVTGERDRAVTGARSGSLQKLEATPGEDDGEPCPG